MAIGTTAKSLIDRAIHKADMDDSNRPDRGQVLNDINDALAELHELLVYEEYFLETSSISLVAGTEEYDLPNDFYKTLMVYKITTDRRYPVEKVTLSELSGFRTTGPLSSGTVELWYAPQLKKLARETSRVSVAFPNGWESFAAIHAAIPLLIQEESDTSAMDKERAHILQRIMSNVEPRDHAMPDMMEDVYDRWGGGIRDTEQRRLRYRVMGDKIRIVEFDYTGV